MATGHYARRALGPGPALVEVREGADRNKDQTYFLALLRQEQLRDARFPIGQLEKPELRRIAREAGLATADKKDSQGICFIGEVRMGDFLRAYVPDRPGPIVRAADGSELGVPPGLHYFTLGQRRGIGVPSNAEHERYVVVGKRPPTTPSSSPSTIPTRRDSSSRRSASIRSAGRASRSWGRSAIEGRVRYRDPRVPLTFEPDGAAGRDRAFPGPSARWRQARCSPSTTATGCSAAGSTGRPSPPSAADDTARTTANEIRTAPIARSIQCPPRRKARLTALAGEEHRHHREPGHCREGHPHPVGGLDPLRGRRVDQRGEDGDEE